MTLAILVSMLARTRVHTLGLAMVMTTVVWSGPSFAQQLRPFDGYPSWSPDGERIVFESLRDGNFEIYVMHSDGGGLIRLTENAAADRIPSFSPDGSKIVFQSTRHSDTFTGPFTYDVYVMDANGSDVRRLTEDGSNNGSARFSPDGASILFTSDRGERHEIFVMGADGSDVHGVTSTSTVAAQLSDESERTNPYWTADGMGILFDTRNPTADRWDVYQLDLESERLTNLSVDVKGPTAEGAFYPSTSRQGLTAISFDHDPDGNTNWEIWLLDTESGNYRRLTTWVGNDFWQTFSPDGEWLAFSSNRDGNYAIYTIATDGTDLRKLTQR